MKRFIGWTRLTVLLALLTLGRLPGGILAGHQGPVGVPTALKVDAASLAQTYVTPHLQQPLTEGLNAVWCSTFQLAWNELHALIGEDIHFQDGDPPMVDVLNQMAASKDDIDSASYVAMAGFVGDGIIDQITQQMQQQFPDASPQLIPSGQGLRPQDIVAYAYLFKQLMFPVPFERMDDPLRFGSAAVSSFGVGPEYKSAQVDMLDQVSILDYRDSDDFIIELQTQSTQDQVILAKIQPGSTLDATIQTVLARITAGTPESTVPGDRLEIPKINFDVSRVYDEIVGGTLLTQNPALADDLAILQAQQDIRFELNEEGVILESEAVITLGCTTSVGLMASHIMVFDQPFLFMIKRTQASRPYFALWIDNAELLVRATQ